jgi:hypothetical protein
LDNINFILGNSDITPRNGRELKITNALVNNSYYQKQLSSDLTLIQSDYDVLKELEKVLLHDKIPVAITSSRGVEYPGEFMIPDCTFDDTMGKATVKTTTRDAMTDILENKDIEVDVLKGDINYTYVTGKKYTFLSFVQVIRLSQGDFDESKTYVDVDLYSPVIYDFHTLAPPVNLPDIETWATEFCYADTGKVDNTWTEVVKGDSVTLYQRKYTPLESASNNITQYIQPKGDSIVNGYGTMWSNWIGQRENFISFGDFYDVYAYNPDSVEATYAHYWIKKDNPPKLEDYQYDPEWLVLSQGKLRWYESVEGIENETKVDLPYFLAIKRSIYEGRLDTGKVITYRCQDLQSFLTNLLRKACPSFTGRVISSFLFPDQATTEPQLYYDEIQLHTLINEDIFKLYVCEKSDFIKPNASEAATKKITTVDKWLNGLNQMFFGQLAYDLTDEGDFRIEHISFYLRLKDGYDATVHNLPTKYYYESGVIPNRVYVDQSETYGTDFTKKCILNGLIPTVDGTNENTQSFSNGYLFTDVDGMNEHLADMSTEGFVLLYCLKTDTTPFHEIYSSSGYFSNETKQNAKLSVANLLYSYSKFEAYKPEYKLVHEIIDENDSAEVVLRKEKAQVALTLKKLKREKITIMGLPENIDKFVNTNLGQGLVLSMDYPAVEGKVPINIELLHG